MLTMKTYMGGNITRSLFSKEGLLSANKLTVTWHSTKVSIPASVSNKSSIPVSVLLDGPDVSCGFVEEEAYFEMGKFYSSSFHIEIKGVKFWKRLNKRSTHNGKD